MKTTIADLEREIDLQRTRASRAEQQLEEIEQLLSTLGVTLWRTDRVLRLTGSYGLVLAEPYLDQPIAEFYRQVYGIEDPDSPPLAAHREAGAGRSVALAVDDGQHNYAILVEPHTDRGGKVIGTAGASVRLGR